VRTLNHTFVAKPSTTVAPACPPPLWDTSVSNAPVFSWLVAAATPSGAVVTARPQSRVEATGAGYAAPAAADRRREVDGSGRDVLGGDAAGTRFIGTNDTNGKQQDQLHLMSRRDPRTWRPPA
jgi:hypothetical protein